MVSYTNQSEKKVKYMKKVIIIGAGPAGITAGYELLKNRDGSQDTYEVLILEESAPHRYPVRC